MEAKILELKTALENVKNFKLVSFHDYIKSGSIIVKLERMLPSGWLEIKEKIIKIKDIDQELKIIEKKWKQ